MGVTTRTDGAWVANRGDDGDGDEDDGWDSLSDDEDEVYDPDEDKDEVYAKDVEDDEDEDEAEDDGGDLLPEPGKPGHEEAIAQCLACAPPRLVWEGHLEEIADGFSAAPKAGVVDECCYGGRDFSKAAW